MTGVVIDLIPATAKRWPKSKHVADMPAFDRELLADYLSHIAPGWPVETDEGLFGATNILHRAGLTWSDLALLVYDRDAEIEETRLAA